MVNMEEIKGKINQAAGELTGDQMRKLKGHMQENLGKGKAAGEETLQKVSREINEMIEKFKRENK